MKNTTLLSEGKISFYFLLLFCLSSISFLHPLFLGDVIRNDRYIIYLHLLLMLFIVYSSLYTFFEKTNAFVFSLPLKIILLAIIFSIISAHFFWNQPLLTCILAVVNTVGGYLLYFYLIRVKPSALLIENIIIIMGTISIGAFYLSLSISPKEIFGNPFDINDFSRGFQRIQLAGFGYIYLLFFMSLNKLVNKCSNKLLWFFLISACYIAIILSLTRTYLAFTTIIAIVYLYINSKFRIKLLLLLLITALVIFLPKFEYVKLMINLTEDNLSESKDYVRIQGVKYFLTEFQQSDFTRIFGNGFAYGDSDYSNFINQLKITDLLYIEDLGIIGLYVYMGILSIIAYILIFFKGIKEKMQKNKMYLKLFLIFVLLISFNSYAIYSVDFLLPLVFVFYLYEINKVENQRIVRNKVKKTI